MSNDIGTYFRNRFGILNRIKNKTNTYCEQFRS